MWPGLISLPGPCGIICNSQIEKKRQNHADNVSYRTCNVDRIFILTETFQTVISLLLRKTRF